MSYTGNTFPMLAMCNPQLLKWTPLFNSVVRNVRRKIFAIHGYFVKQIEELGFDEFTKFSERSFVRNFMQESKLRGSEDRFEQVTFVYV
jgi:hypothetical protein